MFTMNKQHQNEHGLTLVELLAVLVLSVIIITFSTSLILKALHHYELTSTETMLRDEADLIISKMTKDIFSLQESLIIEVKNETTADSTQSYIIVKEDGSEPSYKIGFQDDTILTKEGNLTVENKDISLHNDTQKSSITKVADGEYKIHLVLTHEGKNKTMEFENIINTIQDQDKQ